MMTPQVVYAELVSSSSDRQAKNLTPKQEGREAAELSWRLVENTGMAYFAS